MSRHLKTIAAISTMGFTLCTISFAHAAGLSLPGVVANSCTLTLGGDGALASSTNGLNLSSKNAGGAPATALLLTTSSTFKVEVDQVSTLAQTPAGGQADSVHVSYGSTGVTSLSNIVAGTPANIDFGLTTVRIDVSADKSTIFPAGTYRADVVMRCVSR